MVGQKEEEQQTTRGEGKSERQARKWSAIVALNVPREEVPKDDWGVGGFGGKH